MTTPFKQLAPCVDCPFRKDGAIELHPGRLDDIIATLRSGQSFLCHTRFYAKKRERQPCAGGIVYLMKMGESNQLMQVMGRLGAFPSDAFFAHCDTVIDPPERK